MNIVQENRKGKGCAQCQYSERHTINQQILKGKEESRLTRQKLEIAVEHLLSVLRRLERLDRHDTI